jgi:hypothetical protein
LHINGSGFPGNPDCDVPVAQKMRGMVFLPDGVQDLSRPSCTPAVTPSRVTA